MPYLAPVVSLAAIIAEVNKLSLVPDGNRITDVSILPEPTGLAYSFKLKLGNNPPMGPITGPCTLQVDPDAPDSDVREGLYLINDTAQAGVNVPLVISYRRNYDKSDEPGGVRVLL